VSVLIDKNLEGPEEERKKKLTFFEICVYVFLLSGLDTKKGLSLAPVFLTQKKARFFMIALLIPFLFFLQEKKIKSNQTTRRYIHHS
jgi:hypothetical protein